jgi:O-antigen/teichoic acid export membrane protein
MRGRIVGGGAGGVAKEVPGGRMKAPPPSGLWAAVRGIWQQNQDLLRNGGSLIVTTGASAAFGFIYWVVADRDFSQDAVGYAAAAISLQMLLGTIGEFGLGTMLIGELPRRRGGGGITIASIIASGAGSVILGLLFPLVAILFGAHFPEITGSPGRLALFTVGVALVAMMIVFDDATLGLMRGGVQMSRNLAMAVIKLALLPVAAVVLHDAFGVGIVLTWVIGTTLSIPVALVMLKRGNSRIFHRPDWTQLRQLSKLAMAHNWLNLAIATPPRIIPVLVTVFVSPGANAVFYNAWMLVSFLYMVPQCLSIVLFAIASAAPDVIAEKLRFVLRLSLYIGIPGMLALAVLAHWVLEIFGPNYARTGTIPLLLLILCYIPGLFKAVYIAVCRAQHRVGRAAIVLAIGGLCEAVAAIIGGKADGLIGVCVGYLIVQLIEGMVTGPTVLRAATIRRRVAPEAVAALQATTAQVILESTHLDHQRKGLASLVALASVSVSGVDAATQAWETASLHTFPADDDEDDYPVDEYYLRNQQAGIDALLGMVAPTPSEAESPRP